MISIRTYKEGDERGTWEVFYSSIHKVCVNDYNPEQIEAWAPEALDPNIWNSKIQSIKPFIATIDGNIIGYADLQKSGLIDHFFVHGDYQRLGVGLALMNTIIKNNKDHKILFSEVSHTAKPFFQMHGFKVLRVQHVEMRGVTMTNNVMERREVF